MGLVDIRKAALDKHYENLSEFATGKKGFFDYIDRALTIFRSANRESYEFIRGRVREWRR